METPDLIVIGAGAAGLMCAMTAANRGRRVLIIERSNKPGKKILMSGGGRCNFTNLHVAPDRFLSSNPHFCKSALSRYTQWDFISLVEKHGIEYFEKETVNGLSGQLFCRQSSKLILSMLMEECRQAGVEIMLNCEIEAVVHSSAEWANSASTVGAVSASGPGFYLKTSLGNFSCESLVVAAGGLSVPSLGGSGIGYELAESFGLRLLPRSAGLVPFTFTDSMHAMCERLSGVSIESVLFNDRQSFREDILFTHRGLSGPAALQLSSYWSPGESINASLLPDQNVMEFLLNWKQQHPKTLLRTHLDHLIPRKLVLELENLWWPELAETALAEWPNVWLEAIAQKLESWTLKPAGTEGYRTAEVTLGGVDTRDLSSKTMESTTPGLFFIGEVVDVTGHLGGFNFQWAWSSAYAAGQSV
ncbi:MAG: NAD(P)/FAD-dependent oxidoreductase [Xanthomonadales bacterium]|nr:NAD(P)/FAD-dependent oxidoreductase [Xanthomonadales bacterium]MDH4020268.1 NAD(P)/FAD-dependent oxidoreductase [Xanthomonadales bacterium]